MNSEVGPTNACQCFYVPSKCIVPKPVTANASGRTRENLSHFTNVYPKESWVARLSKL